MPRGLVHCGNDVAEIEKSQRMKNTKLLYFLDSELYTVKTIINDIHSISSDEITSLKLDYFKEKQLYAIILEETVFYPKGGGQPSDVGKIYFLEKDFDVIQVIKKGGVIKHIGYFQENEVFLKGKEVVLKVDQTKRKENTKLHTGGHLIHVLLSLVEEIEHLEPWKANHYPNQAVVEYKGKIDNSQAQTIIQKLTLAKEKVFNSEHLDPQFFYIPEKDPLLKTGFIDLNKVQKNFKSFDKHSEEEKIQLINDQSLRRILFLAGFLGSTRGRLCGGTHLKHLDSLKSLQITGIKSKKGVTRIKYSV
eukprot:snap_masked-scaffold_44-processed-gene-1.4-mRNA-1 protein AED:1.00 eAED:1.00 QI:0/-1/0/0/-1/1/1/0/304